MNKNITSIINFFITMDTTNYMTDTSEVDLTDDEMIKKKSQLTKDNEAYQQELEKKEKEI